MNDERVGQELREAADVETSRDWATVAWREAHTTRRRQVWGALGGLAVAAAALVAVLMLRPWAAGGPGEVDPAAPEEPVFTASETFVFQRVGSTVDPVVPGNPPGGAEVPGVAELAGSTWLLVGHLADGTFSDPDVVIGVDVPTNLEFYEVPGGVSLGVSIDDCGGASRQEPLDLAESGRFGQGTLATTDIGCSDEVQHAEDFWMAALAEGGWLHQSAPDTLLLSVIAPELGQQPPGPSAPVGAHQTVGASYTIAVPEGWVLVHQELLEPDQVLTSCLVPEGWPTDPDLACTGYELTVGGETQGPVGRSFFETEGPMPCYADPAWPQADPAGNPATVGPDVLGPEQVDLGDGAPTASVQSWVGECADGAIFEPAEWWLEEWPVTLTAVNQVGAIDVAALLGGMAVHDPPAPLSEMTGRLDAQGDLVEEDGSVTASLTPSSSCVYGELAVDPSADRGVRPCEDLLQWVAASGDGVPATAIAWGGKVVQLRVGVGRSPQADGPAVPEGSGCAASGPGLPDGRWFGTSELAETGWLHLEVACWFEGDQADLAAAEDGQEEPSNGYYVRPSGSVLAIPVHNDTRVEFYPDGDPQNVQDLPYAEWAAASSARGYALGAWLEVESGSVVSVREQWVP